MVLVFWLLLFSLIHLQCAAQRHAAVLRHAAGLIMPTDALHWTVIPRGPHVTEWVQIACARVTQQTDSITYNRHIIKVRSELGS